MRITSFRTGKRLNQEKRKAGKGRVKALRVFPSCFPVFLFDPLRKNGGEDRNRTYLGPAAAGSTAILKIARATRHPSLSEGRKIESGKQESRKKREGAPRPQKVLPSCFPVFLIDPSGNNQRCQARTFLISRNQRVEIRPFAGIEFGVERFAIGADFEGAAAGWDQRERRDAIAELENFSRQTDGFRRVVSDRAILDPDFGFHRTLLSSREVSGKR